MNNIASSPDLGWPTQRFEEAVGAVVKLLADYVEASVSGHDSVVRYRPISDVLTHLDIDTILSGDGWDYEGLVAFLRRYLDDSTRMHHPHYLAHQVAVPDFPAALADLVHGVINNPMAIYEMGPSAVAAEHWVVNWMLEKIGWRPEVRGGGTEHGAGVLAHGGSLANLTALLAARGVADPNAWEQGPRSDWALLVPPSSHYSVARAVSIMGLGQRALYSLPVDQREVVDPSGLEDALARLERDGRRCLAVVINACSTSTGLHDPIDAVADFCEQHGLWLHVDACHGASALVSSTERHHLAGIEQANSVVWDAHKMLRTSGLCAAVLFRDAASLDAAFSQEASYIFYGDDDNPGINLISRTVECTKAGLGLKVLLNLCWRGETGLARYVEDTYALARTFAAKIRQRPGFECPFAPETNIVCFRYGHDNARQVAIRESLLRAGRFHISSAEVAGVRYLRVTLMAPATTIGHLEDLLDAVVAADRQLA